MKPAPQVPELYTGPGFHFRVPPGWEVDEERQGDDFTVTVRPLDSSLTAFWSLTVMLGRPAPQTALRTILSAYEEEYAELDAYPVDEQVAGRQAVGRDLEFVCLELTNSAGVRVFRTRDFTGVVLYQSTDTEWEDCSPAFRLITGSLECGWEAGQEDDA